MREYRVGPIAASVLRLEELIRSWAFLVRLYKWESGGV